MERVFAMTGVFFSQHSVSLCLLHFVLQGQTCLLLLTSYIFILAPYDEKVIFFLFLALEGHIGLHTTVQLQFSVLVVGASIQFRHSVVSDSL